MLSDLQLFIDQQISLITTIKKSWVDVFKPGTKNQENQVLVRLVGSNEIRDLCNVLEVVTYEFEIYVIGNTNRVETRDLMENLVLQFNDVTNRNKEVNNTRIKLITTDNLSFQFLENDSVVVNKFNLSIMIEKI
jgi:hypothetical protein